MMTNFSLAAWGAMTLTATLTLSAQVPAPPAMRPQPPAPTQPSTRLDRVAIAVTGCLKPWDNTMGTPAADPAVTPGNTPMAGTRYVLLDVETDKPAPATDKPVPTPPPAGSGHPQLAQFVVTAGPGVDLAAHVNHQVRLMGTVDPEPASAAPAVTTPTPRPGDPPGPVVPVPASRAAAEKKWATLTATSVTMVSATCTTSAQ